MLSNNCKSTAFLRKRGSTFGDAATPVWKGVLHTLDLLILDYERVVKEAFMAEKEGTPTDACMSPAVLHKDSGFAVSDAEVRWFIAECKPTKEGTIRTMLQNAGYEAYLASRSEVKVYKSRNRRTKETIMIPGKVFVHTEQKKLMAIMLAYSSVWRFMIDRTTKDRQYAIVPDDEMQRLQYMLGKADNPVLITTDSLKVDQKVKVMRGALAGLDGWYYKKGHASYVVIKVTMGASHYVYTEVPLEDISPL